MKEDYLWDKTGEVDAEIAELERKLGSLRYKRPAEPLPLPTTSRTWFRRSFSPLFAIAATLVILLLAGGLWLGLRRAQSTGGSNAALINEATMRDNKEASSDNSASVNEPPKTSQSVSSGSERPLHNEPIDPDGTPGFHKDQKQSVVVQASASRRVIRHAMSESLQASAKAPAMRSARRTQREEIARGQEAKAQLIKALLITSDKLNAVQKKIQATPEHNPLS